MEVFRVENLIFNVKSFISGVFDNYGRVVFTENKGVKKSLP
jgi:hypothetical protein